MPKSSTLSKPTDLPGGAHVLAETGFGTNWIKDLIEDQDCTARIPNRHRSYIGNTCSQKRDQQRNRI